MATANKRKLSGSTDGKAIKIAATATPGTTLHTAVNSLVAGTFDEVWIWLYNSHTADVEVTFEFGATTAPDNQIKITVPFKAGLILAIPGMILQNALVIAAFAGTTNVVTAQGFVNAITD